MKITKLKNLYKNNWHAITFCGILLVGCFVFLVVPDIAHAIKFDPFDQLGEDKSGLPESDAETTIYQVIRGFLQFVGIIALILIIYGGFTWMTGGGNQEKIRKGREILFWAIIGTLVILSSLGILEFIDTII